MTKRLVRLLFSLPAASLSEAGPQTSMMKQKAPTLSDVARSAGVSPFTVSVVLNGARSNTRVSEATRQRIFETAAALRYHPNGVARNLARRRTNTLGVFVGVVESAVALGNPYASGVLQGIVTRAAASGYDVLLYTEHWQDAARSAARFRDRRSDGVILIAPLTDTDILEGLASLDIPLAAVSPAQEHTPASVSCADVDNVRGVHMAVEHLLSLGHRRIAHLTGDANLASVHIRRTAFLDAMARADIATPPEYVVACTYDAHTIPQVVPALLSLPHRPTAIVAGNDNLAIAAMDAAQQAGVSVPEELSVVGFDDIASASLVTPKLTTVRQPLGEIGRAVADSLIRELEGETDGAEKVRLIEPELIVRCSTAPLTGQ